MITTDALEPPMSQRDLETKEETLSSTVINSLFSYISRVGL